MPDPSPPSPAVPTWGVALIVLGVGIAVTLIGAAISAPIDAAMVAAGLPGNRSEVVVPFLGAGFGVAVLAIFLRAVVQERRRRIDAGESGTGWLVGAIALGVATVALALWMVLLVLLFFFAG